MTKIPFKPSKMLFKINPSLHHLLVHSKPSLLIYNTSQSILKWGRCVRFTKITCFPDLLRVKWSHTWMYKLSWVQTTWVRKYTQQDFQRFKPRTKRSSVAPGAALWSLVCCADLWALKAPFERSNHARTRNFQSIFQLVFHLNYGLPLVSTASFSRQNPSNNIPSPTWIANCKFPPFLSI